MVISENSAASHEEFEEHRQQCARKYSNRRYPAHIYLFRQTVKSGGFHVATLSGLYV